MKNLKNKKKPYISSLSDFKYFLSQYSETAHLQMVDKNHDFMSYVSYIIYLG